jgi:class 3 adenylate cyclase
VNLAARAVKIATPSTLLVDRATSEELSGAPGLILGGPSAQSLKGFAEPVELWPVSPGG